MKRLKKRFETRKDTVKSYYTCYCGMECACEWAYLTQSTFNKQYPDYEALRYQTDM